MLEDHEEDEARDGRDDHHREQEEDRDEPAAAEGLEQEQRKREPEHELDGDAHDRDQTVRHIASQNAVARQRLPVAVEPVPVLVGVPEVDAASSETQLVNPM